MTALAFCEAVDDPNAAAPLRCDLRPGHGGERHKERYVATWRRDGSDVRWYTGDCLIEYVERKREAPYAAAPAPQEGP
jgi:hypothetical protein